MNQLLRSLLKTLKRLGVSFLCVSLLATGCTGYRLRTPSLQEKRNFLFSENLDQAIIDPLEKGPLQVLNTMTDDGEGNFSTPLRVIKHQKNLLEGDIIKADYDEGESGGVDDTDTAKDRTQTVFIAILIVVGIAAGIAVPLLISLHVF